MLGLAEATKVELPAPGDLVAGKYSIVRRIGEGGMGVVYEATHIRLRQRLAIKVLRPDASHQTELMARFEREARITAQLRSIHSARIMDVDRLPNGLPYIVLEYLEGHDLEAELAAGGPLAIDQAVDVVIQVATAMSEAHELGIVHRDLKPSNLFLCRVGDRRIAKILDFGISRFSGEDESRITSCNSYIGTPLYAAPEQLLDPSGADARSDIWSLGVVLFELLTGRTPFTGVGAEVVARVMVNPVPWVCDLRSDIPRDLATVVLCALERDTSKRLQSMREFASALKAFGPTKTIEDALPCAKRARGRLGEILVDEGFISSDDLRRALDQQRKTSDLLGLVLLDLGLISRADLVTALTKQQGIDDDAAPLSDKTWGSRTPSGAASGIIRRRRAERSALTGPASARMTSTKRLRSAILLMMAVAFGLLLLLLLLSTRA